MNQGSGDADQKHLLLVLFNSNRQLQQLPANRNNLSDIPVFLKRAPAVESADGTEPAGGRERFATEDRDPIAGVCLTTITLAHVRHGIGNRCRLQGRDSAGNDFLMSPMTSAYSDDVARFCHSCGSTLWSYNSSPPSWYRIYRQRPLRTA